MNLAKANRISLWILTIGAVLVAGLILVTATISIADDLVTGTTVLRQATSIPVPQSEFPAYEEDFVATYTGIDIRATSLSSSIVAWLAAAQGAMALAYLLVALSVAYLGWRLLRGDPFRRSLTIATLTASLALMVGWALATGITSITTFFGLEEIVGENFMTAGYPYTFAFDPGPFLIGIVLGIVAGAFEYGEKLRADTVGLV